MECGKEDLIFHRECYEEDGYLYLQLTDQFKRCWEEVIEGKNYQIDFDTYILKALVLHYERALKIKKEDWDTDRMSGISCLLRDMKNNLFESQTKITLFEGEQNG